MFFLLFLQLPFSLQSIQASRNISSPCLSQPITCIWFSFWGDLFALWENPGPYLWSISMQVLCLQMNCLLFNILSMICKVKNKNLRSTVLHRGLIKRLIYVCSLANYTCCVWFINNNWIVEDFAWVKCFLIGILKIERKTCLIPADLCKMKHRLWIIWCVGKWKKKKLYNSKTLQ